MWHKGVHAKIFGGDSHSFLQKCEKNQNINVGIQRRKPQACSAEAISNSSSKLRVSGARKLKLFFCFFFFLEWVTKDLARQRGRIHRQRNRDRRRNEFVNNFLQTYYSHVGYHLKLSLEMSHQGMYQQAREPRQVQPTSEPALSPERVVQVDRQPMPSSIPSQI